MKNEPDVTEYEKPAADAQKVSAEFVMQENSDIVDTNQPDEATLAENSDNVNHAEQSAESPSENEPSAVPPPEPEKPAKKKRAGKIFRNILLVVAIALGILSLLGVFNEVGEGDGASLGEIVRGASPVFFVVLILILLTTMLLDVSKFCIITKTVTGKFGWGVAAKTNFIGRYYDAVTPFSTGGQPMQIYYLNTKGISGGNSSAIVLIRYIFSIVCWIILGGALMIAGSVKGVLEQVPAGNVLLIAGWIGIAVNMIVPMFVILFVVLPKFMRKLTVGVIKLGNKMRIVKDVDKTTEKAIKVVDDFKSAFKLMATSPVKFVLLMLVCFTESALTFSIPFFVMKTFACPVDGLLLDVMALNVFAIFGVSFIPTPGNSGVMEGIGALAFSIAAGETLVWSVITWRFLVFYIYIIIGLVMTVCDVIIKNVADKKSKTPPAPPASE